MGKLPFYNEKPYKYNFNKPLKHNKFAYSFFTPIANVVLKYKFKELEVHGLENVPTGGGFIMAGNHLSGFDPIYITYILRKHCNMCFMAKEEFFHTFYTRIPLLWLSGFPVKRGTADRSALEFAIQSIKNGFCLLIFPQGTRDKTFSRPERGKSGIALIAREAKVGILPVSIHRESAPDVKRPKMVIRFGELIPYEDLGFSEGETKQRDLKNVTQLVMRKICELWDKDN